MIKTFKSVSSNNSQEGIITQEESIFQHPLILSSHWTLVRLKFLTVLRGYVRHLACHLLIVSSLSLAWSSSLKAMEKDDPVDNLSEFYKGKDHPLTQAFWKDKDLSERLGAIRKDIEGIKEKLISSPKDSISELMRFNLGHYRNILTCSQCDNSASGSLMDAHLSAFYKAWDQASTSNIGCTNTSVTILSRGPTNVIAIKTFKDTKENPASIQEGLEELLYSLLAHRMNPSPSQLKMAWIYDAIICPKKSLSLIMEGANTHDIHYFLATGLAASVVKACAQYLAKFHIGNYKKNKTLIKGKEYLSHKADPYHKTAYDPLKDNNELSLKVRKQRSHLKTVTAQNIIRLLTKEDQEQFERLVKSNRSSFKGNCEKIFRSLKGSGTVGTAGFYFLTKTHGDAHGNNFFYNDEEDLSNSEGIIRADSFYRISMIDYASIIRTCGGIGDPAEDVGRFLGSLWDWAARPGNERYSDYGRLIGLQNKFLQAYLQIITDEEVLSSEQQDKFHTIFKENTTFYKFRFYKAIFNSKKDEETKLRLLRSWMRENADTEIPFTNYILKGPLSSDRPWKPITERTLHWLPNQLEGFIESHRESGESYLTSLWQQFNGGVRTATISSTIAGMGGVGKTSLALAYAHEALDNKGYHLIYWLLSETESSLLKGYRDLLDTINVVCKDEDDSRLIDLIKEHLPSQGKCLLIYDNVPDPQSLEGKMPEASHIDILITSRRREGWRGKLIDLAVFRPEESVHYLLQTIGLKDTPDTQAKVGELAEELGHLPLALSHAAYYLKLVGAEKAPGYIIDKYIKKFRETPIDHFKKRQNPLESGKSAINYKNLIEKTLYMTREKLSGLAQQLMIYCAYLDPDTIVEEIFLRGLQGNSQEEIQEAFEQLSAYSLIKKRENNAVFHIHRLLQLVILNKQERNKKKVDNLASLRGIFGRASLSEDRTLMKIKNRGGDLLNLHERLGKYRTSLERVIRHCQAVKIDESILASYQRIYKRINESYTSSREEIFKGINALPENSPEEDKAISLLEKELKEGGLTLDNEQCRIIFRLIPQRSQQSERLRIARVLSPMGLSHCQRFAGIFKLLIKPNISGKRKVTIIEALAKIDLDQRQGFIDSAKQLMTPEMEGDAQAIIFKALAKIDLDQRQGFIDSAKQLLASDMSGYDQASIIKALAKVAPSQRQNVIDSAKQLFTPEVRGDAQATIIEALAKTNPHQMQNVAEAIKKLITSDMSGYMQISSIKALANVDPDQRQSVAEAAKQLITSKMWEDEQADIIATLAEVEADQRQSVAEAAKKLITPEMNRYERAFIIKALAEVEADQRQSVVQAVKKLFTPEMSGYDQASIITALAEVEADQRQSVIDSAKHLFTPEMSEYARASIIRALVEVGANQRQSVVQAVKQLFTPDMSEYARASIIRALVEVGANQRQSVAQAAKLLITPEMSGYERASIIKVVVEVGANQRQSVAQAAKLLITPEMSGYERASIIKVVVEVEADQRQSVIDSAKHLFTPEMSGYGQASIIRALAEVKADQRQGFIDSVKQLFTPKMRGDERSSIILKACKEIEATQRQRVAQVTEQSFASRMRESVKDSVSQTQFVIDLGSSGVQLGGFKVNLEKRIVEEQVFSKKERILLQAAIHNRILPDDVQKRTVSALKTLLSEAGVNPAQTKIVGFATAWARAADNSNQLIEAIKSETAITITIIDQQIEGEIGFNATLAALRSLMVDRESFLYQTENGKEILGKMTGNNPDNPLIPQTIMSWDIGGGSMQLAKQNNDNRIEVIGSTDASTTFANAVIELKRDLSEEEESLSQEILPPDTPNPLSRAQVREVINLAQKKAARFIDHSFLDGLKSKTREVFGLGLMHKSNREYINKLLGLKEEHFYRKGDLEEAVDLLTDKGDR